MTQQATLLTGNTPDVQIVPFHGSELQLIEHNAEPYTPMKPVVEGMGLTWKPQFQKLNDNAERWGVTILVIPTSSGIQDMLCMPLRKLPAFFASISVNKVREELRATIILFQNECDDALWKYWTGQQVQRECKPVAALPSPDAPITPDQQCTLQAIVKAKVEAIPEEERSRGIYPQIWGRFKNRFRVAKYDQLPQSRMSEAVAYLTAMELRKELPEPAAPAPTPVPLDDSQERMIRAKAEEMRKLMWKAGNVMRELRGIVIAEHARVRPNDFDSMLITNDLHEANEKAFRAFESLADTIAYNVMAIRKMVKARV